MLAPLLTTRVCYQERIRKGERRIVRGAVWTLKLTAGVSGGEAERHDGRARTNEEAILCHGGEMDGAKETFRTMSVSNRARSPNP